MSPTSVTWRRTVGFAHNLYSTAMAFGAFVAVSSAYFVWLLSVGEGGTTSLTVLWATSVSLFLPVLAALAGMDVWSDERQTGRIELLMTVPVTERELTLGKFAGVFTLVMLAVLAAFAIPCAYLFLAAPSSMNGIWLLDFVPAFFVLALQAALWSAVTVACSAMFCHSAAAAAMSVTLTTVLPRGIWGGLAVWSSGGSTALGEMPFDAHVSDIASGIVPVWTIVIYLVPTVMFLFIASKTIAALRLVGGRKRIVRMSTALVMLLSVVLAAVAMYVSRRLDMTLDLPVGGVGSSFSSRTRSILGESSGEVVVTCFLSRKDARWRSAARLLRGLRREAAAQGGARFTLSFVDPHWDIGAAERLVRRGVVEESLVFERGSRMVSMPLSEGFGERECASTVRRLTTPPRRRDVCWSVGHGESRFDGYDAYGMSDIARDLAREGYRNQTIDLAQVKLVPGSCALIVIAGAKQDFSRSELDRLDAYLKEGGRLLVLVGEGEISGLRALLATWGIRADAASAGGGKTLSGSDVIVSGFSGHAVSAPLKGTRIVLERPFVFAPSATAGTLRGADRLEFSPIASSGELVYAAAVERGGDAGADVAVRPTRLVAVGDPTFVLNASLAARANANRDFFLNCIAYLAGTETSAASGMESGVLVTGLDRDGRRRMLLVTSLAAPGFLFLAMLLSIVRRRRRK